MKSERCEIRGLGVVSPIGVSLEEFWASAIVGRCGIVRDEELRRLGLRSQVCARVDSTQMMNAPDWDENWRSEPRVIQMALVAAAQAWSDAALSPARSRSRTALVFSSAMGIVGGLGSPGREPRSLGWQNRSHSTLSDVLATTFGIAGPVIGISDGCTGGLDAFITACELLQAGEADTCLVAASDAPLDALTIAAMDNLGVLSRRNDDPREACPSFSMARQGMVMAEGAAAFVLERHGQGMSSSVGPLACVETSASVSNCRSMVSLREASEDMARCIQLALKRGGLCPEDIDHLNVHGSGTLQNDEAEATALQSVFGHRLDLLPAVALKSLVGHGLAASNLLELVAEVMMLRTGVLPPAIGNGDKNPWGVKLVTGEALSYPARRGLKLNHGFGGFHSCVVVSMD